MLASGSHCVAKNDTLEATSLAKSLNRGKVHILCVCQLIICIYIIFEFGIFFRAELTIFDEDKYLIVEDVRNN